MAVSVAAVMRHCRNFFEVGYIDGDFTVSGNAITPAPDSLWCFVTGSRFHDGVWQLRNGVIDAVPDDMDDEVFSGRVWLLKPPRDFIELCGEISAYDDKNPVGALLQEKFGNYSYMRGYDESSKPWWSAYASRLSTYRKMFTEVG